MGLSPDGPLLLDDNHHSGRGRDVKFEVVELVCHEALGRIGARLNADVNRTRRRKLIRHAHRPRRILLVERIRELRQIPAAFAPFAHAHPHRDLDVPLHVVGYVRVRDGEVRPLRSDIPTCTLTWIRHGRLQTERDARFRQT